MKIIHKLSSVRPPHSSGFSLMELVVAMAIIAILAAIAYPSYTNQVMKSRRAVAKNALLDMANREEQYFFDKGYYADAANKLTGYTSYSTTIHFNKSGSPTTGSTDSVYDVSILEYNNANCDSVSSNPVCFKLQAVPQNSQSGDACATFTIDSSNKKLVTSSASDCW